MVVACLYLPCTIIAPYEWKLSWLAETCGVVDPTRAGVLLFTSIGVVIANIKINTSDPR